MQANACSIFPLKHGGVWKLPFPLELVGGNGSARLPVRVAFFLSQEIYKAERALPAPVSFSVALPSTYLQGICVQREIRGRGQAFPLSPRPWIEGFQLSDPYLSWIVDLKPISPGQTKPQVDLRLFRPDGGASCSRLLWLTISGQTMAQWYSVEVSRNAVSGYSPRILRGLPGSKSVP
jgi:hypothetical protein